MAKEKARTQAPPDTGGRSPDPPVNGEEGLKKLADLTRAVIAVPKSEVVDPTPKKKRGH
jgi:hypothetical protein